MTQNNHDPMYPQITPPAHRAEKQKRGMGFRVVLATLAISTAIGSAFGAGYVIRDQFGGEQPAFASNETASSQKEQATPTEEIADSAETKGDSLSHLSVSTVTTPVSASVSDIVTATKDSVVSINMTAQVTNRFNYVSNISGAGSGIIFHEDDEKIYIVTNHHVIDSATEVTISLDDELAAPANLVGSDEESDIAVISVQKESLAEAGITTYQIATFAGSETIQVGDTAVAIGNAAGEGKSATLGIISAVDKRIDINGISLQVLQTDAAINPGNSGGPLVNAHGQVVGINTAKLSETGVEGMGYAIPSDVVAGIIDQIMKHGSVERPHLGAYISTITERIQWHYGFASTGVYVNAVDPNTTAEAAGLQAGDIIIRYNGTTITNVDQLLELEAQTAVGEKVSLVVIRNNHNEITLSADMQAYVGRTNF